MEIQAAARAAPSTENTSVRTRQVARTRRYLTSREIEKLMKAARDTGRYGHRDATMILIAYRHGLRACELAICNGTRSS
jgi:integrase